MRIEARKDAIHIILSVEEAEAVQIDHGEGEVCIPVDDTFEIPAILGAALRAVVRDDAREDDDSLTDVEGPTPKTLEGVYGPEE